MTDRDLLLSGVLADPADDTIRLVLADLLRESEDEGDHVLGRFLWAGVTAAQFQHHEFINDPLYYAAHAEIEAVVVAGEPYRWLSALGITSLSAQKVDWLWDCTLDRVTLRSGGTIGLFSRGMLAELTIGWDEWETIAPAVLSAWPLEAVHFSDRPGLSFAIDRTTSGWRISGQLAVLRRRVPLGGGVIPSSVSPIPFLTEEGAEWRVEEVFPDRGAMVAALAPVSSRLAAELREFAGDRWPQPPRRRR